MPGPKPGALPLGDTPTLCFFCLKLEVKGEIICSNLHIWLGYKDSNLGMPGPKPGALPLGDTPTLCFFCLKLEVKGEIIS